ncbi:MAG: cbb3-type cytochrome oxidase assembly protein CcoS, partial [Pseudomonadota bacterium]
RRDPQRLAPTAEHQSMTVLGILIPASLALGAVGLVAFLWSLRAKQYEDLEGTAARILLDDRDPEC